jgi:hypothetical protein
MDNDKFEIFSCLSEFLGDNDMDMKKIKEFTTDHLIQGWLTRDPPWKVCNSQDLSFTKKNVFVQIKYSGMPTQCGIRIINNVIATNCLIHQQNLCSQILSMNHVIQVGSHKNSQLHSTTCASAPKI